MAYSKTTTTMLYYYYEVRRKFRQRMRNIFRVTKPITYQHSAKIKICIAAIIFLSSWHFLGVKLSDSTFTEVDEVTGKITYLNPQDVKRDVKSKMKKLPRIFDPTTTPIIQRQPIEISKVKFDLDDS